MPSSATKSLSPTRRKKSSKRKRKSARRRRRERQRFWKRWSDSRRQRNESRILPKEEMRVFLAGATGVVGPRLAALLRDAKHEVTGTTRTPEKAAMLRALDVTPVLVDVFEP